jgi:hypothetical protein
MYYLEHVIYIITLNTPDLPDIPQLAVRHLALLPLDQSLLMSEHSQWFSGEKNNGFFENIPNRVLVIITALLKYMKHILEG